MLFQFQGKFSVPPSWLSTSRIHPNDRNSELQDGELIRYLILLGISFIVVVIFFLLAWDLAPWDQDP